MFSPLLPKIIEAALFQRPPDPWLVYELQLANTSKWAYALQMYETGLELMEGADGERVDEYISDLVNLVEADSGALEVAMLLLLCPLHRRR